MQQLRNTVCKCRQLLNRVWKGTQQVLSNYLPLSEECLAFRSEGIWLDKQDIGSPDDPATHHEKLFHLNSVFCFHSTQYQRYTETRSSWGTVCSSLTCILKYIYQSISTCFFLLSLLSTKAAVSSNVIVRGLLVLLFAKGFFWPFHIKLLIWKLYLDLLWLSRNLPVLCALTRKGTSDKFLSVKIAIFRLISP